MGITKKKKITQLPPADSVSGSEWVEIVQNGVNKKALAGQIAASGGGVPAGGTTGQVLAKASNTNYDTEWVAPGGGSDRRTVTAITSSSGIVTLDYSLGDYFTLTPSENITGWTITNLPGTGKGGTVAIQITQTSPARTVALPTGSTLKGGNANAMPTGNGTVALLFLTTFNNGTTWEATWGVDYS